MEAKHPQISASTVMADQSGYSAFIDGFEGAAHAGNAWSRIEWAARGRADYASGYAGVDVRRKSDGEWFSVFRDEAPRR